MDENQEMQQAKVEDPNLRKCVICTKAIPERPYQAKSVRTCSPGCAKRLAVQEHPDIEIRSLHLARATSNHKEPSNEDHEED